MFTNEGDSDTAAFEIEMLLNPVSVRAQRFVPVLHFLRTVFQIKMSVFLHTRLQLLEMPLQQYYRMAFSNIHSSDVTSTPVALFENLPGNKILTLNPETPSAWLVEPTKADMDLDNLRLMDVKGDGLFVEYGLESILLTGSCVDTTARSRRDVYPRGLQLKLGTRHAPKNTLCSQVPHREREKHRFCGYPRDVQSRLLSAEGQSWNVASEFGRRSVSGTLLYGSTDEGRCDIAPRI